MKKIGYKNSARQRTPQVSLGSDKRVKAMRRVGITQLTGTNPVWWIDYSQTRVAEGTAIDATAVPQRKAVSWSVSGPAARAAWTSDGMEFAGAQSYSRGSGNDINGQTQLTLISVYEKTTTNAGQLLESGTGGFYVTRGIIQAPIAAGPLFSAEGPTPTNSRTTVAEVGVKEAAGTYWDTANPVPADTILVSRSGQTAQQTASTVNPKGTAFSTNNLYIGSRGSASVFFEGFIKVMLFLQGENSQTELNNLTRVAQWSVK